MLDTNDANTIIGQLWNDAGKSPRAGLVKAFVPDYRGDETSGGSVEWVTPEEAKRLADEAADFESAVARACDEARQEEARWDE